MGTTEFVSMLVFLGVFGLISAVVFVYFRFDRDTRQAVARLHNLSNPETANEPKVSLWELILSAIPRIGGMLLPGKKEKHLPLQTRLHQAGFYKPQAPAVFLGVRFFLMVLLPILAWIVCQAAGFTGRPQIYAILFAAGIGLSGPGIWLDGRGKKRQTMLRQGLPDALDMLVLCLEGGISLRAGIQRVTAEIQTAHPLLAAEFGILQREIQLGLSAGEAMSKFAERSGVAEIRLLGSVIVQSERFGASISKALRIHADSCRLERYQAAEEMAQKASVKILFPTLLCIFPAIFIVLLGPAAFQIATMFSQK